MDKRQLEKRKKIIYEFICDSLYVPMKMKELAVILSVPKERRAELEEAVEALLKEGKIEAGFRKWNPMLWRACFAATREGLGLCPWKETRKIFLFPLIM